MITEGKMQYLYDDKGRRYLDVSTLPCPLHFSGTCAASSASADATSKHETRHSVCVAGRLGRLTAP